MNFVFVYLVKGGMDSSMVAVISVACVMGVVIMFYWCYRKKSQETQANSSNANDVSASYENHLCNHEDVPVPPTPAPPAHKLGTSNMSQPPSYGEYIAEPPPPTYNEAMEM